MNAAKRRNSRILCSTTTDESPFLRTRTADTSDQVEFLHFIFPPLRQIPSPSLRSLYVSRLHVHPPPPPPLPSLTAGIFTRPSARLPFVSRAEDKTNTENEERTTTDDDDDDAASGITRLYRGTRHQPCRPEIDTYRGYL